jgi:hypothetical protein
MEDFSKNKENDASKEASLWEDIFSVLRVNEKKKNKQNRKTTQRRNQLRKENGKTLKRWSKWWKHSQHECYIKEIHDLKFRITDKINTLLRNWNIIKLFESYWVHLKETYKSFIWLCYKHKEETPSFVVSKQKWICKCFGCGGWWWPILYTLFDLEFWEWVVRKEKRWKILEQKIDTFMNLLPINIYTVEWEPNPLYLNSIGPDHFSLEYPKADKERLEEKNPNTSSMGDLPF